MIHLKVLYNDEQPLLVLNGSFLFKKGGVLFLYLGQTFSVAVIYLHYPILFSFCQAFMLKLKGDPTPQFK